MKRKLFLMYLGVLSVASFAQFNKQNVNLSIYYDNNIFIGQDYEDSVIITQLADSFRQFENTWSYKNIRIFPVVANVEFQEETELPSNYLSLQQALQKQVITVAEVSQGGTVNTLKLSNSGQDTILIMAGEVVLGGKQDRALAEQLVLPPGAQNVEVKVFCVESGRWVQGSEGTHFNGYYGFAANQVRKKVVVDKNQSEVWGKVSESHNKAGVNSSTHSFKDIRNSEDYENEVLKYKGYFLPKLMSEENLIGFVIASGDQILGAEMFSSKELMQKQIDKLLESYITEAIQEGSVSTVTVAEVEAYMAKILDEEKQEEIIKEKGTDLKVKGKKLHMSVLEEKK